MTFTQLQALVALAETGGFTAAGARLGMGQSAVSHAIKALEKSLGVELVDRRNARVTLSDAAQRLLPDARAALVHAESMRQQASASKRLSSGTLRIGSFGPTSSLRLLPKLLADFARRYPGVEPQVDEGPDDLVHQWLIERRVDLGFVVLPDARFETVPLVEDEFVVLVPKLHELAQFTAVAPAALNDLPFVMAAAGSRAEIEPLLQRYGVRPRILFRMPQIASVLGIVERGLALSVVARLALPENHPGVEYRPLKPRARRRVGLAMRSETELPAPARAFVEIARKWASRRALSDPV